MIAARVHRRRRASGARAPASAARRGRRRACRRRGRRRHRGARRALPRRVRTSSSSTSRCRKCRAPTLAAILPEPRPFVVFATAFDRYALDAFAVDATDYLVKPITQGPACRHARTRARAAVAPLRHRARSGRGIRGAGDAPAARAARPSPATIPPRSPFPRAAWAATSFISQPIDDTRGSSRAGRRVGQGHAGGARGLEPAGPHRNGRTAWPWNGDRHRRGRQSLAVQDTDAARFATLVYVELDIERSLRRSSTPAIAADRPVAPGASRRSIDRPDRRSESCRTPIRRHTLALHPGGVRVLQRRRDGSDRSARRRVRRRALGRVCSGARRRIGRADL